jgi:hypothetical protein
MPKLSMWGNSPARVEYGSALIVRQTIDNVDTMLEGFVLGGSAGRGVASVDRRRGR